MISRLKGFLIAVLFFSFFQANGQGVWVYGNVADLVFRTVDVGLAIHPKNEDWLRIMAGAGYTIKGSHMFRNKNDCVSSQGNGGYFFRLGARNGLTADHHESHLYWGLDLLVVKYNETGMTTACDPILPNQSVSGKGIALGGMAEVGYTWNVSKQSHKPRVVLDLGLRAGIPMYNSSPFLASRNFLPGIGYGKVGNKGINLGPVINFRYELWHGRYGFFKIGKIKRKE